ncbi:MAG: histidinol-phosphatase [Alphaproteobacteria bacterium]|nr:histidinol-phosphatase [Alphaproteobacteria bacterium]
MSDTQYDRDLDIAMQMADAARAAALPYFRAPLVVENKLDGGFDPVTAADRAAEQAMRDILERHRPDDGICGEEFGNKASTSGREWVLDPVDGTRAFIAGLPTWTVLIALADQGVPKIGVIDQPHNGERFIGWPGGACYQRGAERIELRNESENPITDAIMATTDPYLFEGDEGPIFQQLRNRVRLCRYGYDAYAYAMIAAGSIDLVVESGLQKYDVAALIPVVEGAGGRVTNWSGGPAHEGGQVIAAANAEIHSAAIEILKPAAR